MAEKEDDLDYDRQHSTSSLRAGGLDGYLGIAEGLFLMEILRNPKEQGRKKYYQRLQGRTSIGSTTISKTWIMLWKQISSTFWVGRDPIVSLIHTVTQGQLVEFGKFRKS